MKYYCYILYSVKLDKYYVGHTGDELVERLRRHNSNHKGYTVSLSGYYMIFPETVI
ncbi:GIY-YIG nuclease family protein [Mangrovivirga sp. M17]|uniref:GIY-YIG nuclease family protein n=1 Tax=Mangrovivirga halotolerans TaxID=2993936 RepID=A0ABT3RW73_9BACT|nr:GIY-YIG nuclease family protein [Mangrovivirga halotolerans]